MAPRNRTLLSHREKVSSVAAGWGLVWLLERLPRRPGILIINYHRIGDAERDLYDPGLIEATPDEFDDQMAALKKAHVFTELAEVQELAERPDRLRHSLILVTLDDGYRDNHDVALPILRSHGIRAAFFLATGFVGTSRVPWWDQIAYAVRHTERRRWRLRYPKDESLDLDEAPMASTIQHLLKICKHPGTETRRFLAEVEEVGGVALPHEASERLFMTWDEARTLVDAGMAIGSHTHTHELLAKLSREQQLDECRRSREVIRHELSVDVDTLAFPVGGRKSFSGLTQDCLRETGYRTAFSFYGGVNTPRSLRPLDMVRVSPGRTELAYYRARHALAAVTAHEFW